MSADEIRADIAATRAELAQTADALAAKVQQKAQLAKRVAAGVAGAAVVLVIVSRLRNRSS